jgi:hypothetical protein
MERTFQKAARSVLEKLRQLPSDASQITQIALRLKLNEIRTVIEHLQSDYGKLLTAGMLDLAQHAAEREAVIAKFVDAEVDSGLAETLLRNFNLSDGSGVTVKFGRVALNAVSAVANRLYADGLMLSNRLYSLNAFTAQQVEDAIVQGVTEGTNARELAKKIKPLLGLVEPDEDNPTRDTPIYRAMRIARTELGNAYREGHVASTIDPITGRLKPYVLAIGWRLSLGHPTYDICDVWAADDTGLGPGNYEPGFVPIDHPHGLCYTTSVMADPELQDIGVPNTVPNVTGVPDGQLAYYANQGDGPASRAQSTRGV